MVKNLPANSGDMGSKEPPGEGNGNPLKCSCLENPMDRVAWCVTVHRVTKSWIQLKQLSMQEIGRAHV